MVFAARRFVENGRGSLKQEGQHPLTGQRAASFRLLAIQ